jgi:hypothetical protein
MQPVRDPFTFTAATSPSAATMVINTCRKCALPVIVNRMSLAMLQLTLKGATR